MGIPTKLDLMGRHIYRSKTKWRIEHDAGILNIKITGATNLLWTLPDSSTRTADQLNETVIAGTTIVTCDDFSASNIEVYIYTSTALDNKPIPLTTLPDIKNHFLTTCDCLTGDIVEFPRLSNFLKLHNLSRIRGDVKNTPRTSTSLQLGSLPNINGGLKDLSWSLTELLLNSVDFSGTFADLPNVSTTIRLTNLDNIGTFAGLPRASYIVQLQYLDNITGSPADVPIGYVITQLSDLPGLVGDISTLPVNGLSQRIVYNCPNIYGDLSVGSGNSIITFYGHPQVTPADYDQTIHNVVVAGKENGTLTISSRRTSASDADIQTLISRGWTIDDSKI